MFEWDPTLSVDLYSDASNFATGYYITQTQDRKIRFIIYNLFMLLPAKWNYDTYSCELVVIVKFAKKYSYILHAKRQSVVYMDHKPLVEFLNTKYHENIFTCWANKLRLLNIPI